MNCFLRDRSDGQVEIVILRTVQIGLFPNWNTAEAARNFLNDSEPELPADDPSRFAQAARDVAEADDLSGILPKDAAPVRKSRHRTRNLPAIISPAPQAPVQRHVLVPHDLSDEQIQQAFARVQQGENIHAVAKEFGLVMGQLCTMWASHKRRMQRHMAESGPQPCRHCQRLFIPSITHPETCARCSRD